jgi:probable HAF family extracellular repeat protein
MREWKQAVMPPKLGLSLLAAAALLSGPSCSGDDVAAPVNGTLEIITTTGGAEPDADGYAVTIDEGSETAIGANATLQLDNLELGNHTVRLAGMAGNCTVAGENPRTVSIAAGETGTISFIVTCTATTGSLQVTSSTSGPSPDADGYSLTVDGADRGSLGASGGIRVDGLTSGSHEVGLSGVAGNCRVEEGNPRAATVIAGQTVAVAFTIACTAPPANTGTLRIVTVTTGADLDPNGYAFVLDAGATQPVGVNATLTIGTVAPGSHTVALDGLAANCSIEGENPRDVVVSVGQTATLSFTVRCRTVSTSYRAIDLGTLGGRESKAYGINAAGAVVGSSRLGPDKDPSTMAAFLWKDGAMTDLGGRGEDCCATDHNIARAINARGQVVGSVDFADVGDPEAFLWDGESKIELGGLGGVESNAVANGINDAGQVVGTDLSGQSEMGSQQHVFLWQDGDIDDLGPGVAYGINTRGQIVGGNGHAFLWDNGIFTDLGTLGGSTSTAYAINPASRVVGNSTTTAGQEHAFLWRDGVMTDLGTLGGDRSVAYGINAAGQIVGSSNKVPGGPDRPLLWEDGVMTDLGTLGGSQGVAHAINGAGQIVGWSETAAGEIHATLWTRE